MRILREFSQYWTTELSSERVDAYHARWCGIPDRELVQAAAIVADSTREYFPPPGVVKDIALGLLDQEPDAGTAWMMVEKYAHGNAVNLTPRIKTALSAMGGNCKEWDPKDLSFRRREFGTLYEAESQRWREAVASGRLALPEPNERRLTDGN